MAFPAGNVITFDFRKIFLEIKFTKSLQKARTAQHEEQKISAKSPVNSEKVMFLDVFDMYLIIFDIIS